jgi:hypothetical protein
MKKLLVCLLLLTFVCSVFAYDELWQKAQAIAENSWNLVPGKTTVQSENITTTSKYTFKLGYEIVVGLSLGEDGAIKSELISKSIHDNYDELKKNTGIPKADLNNLKRELDDVKASFNNQVNEQLSDDDKPEKNGIFFENDRKILTLNKQKKTQVIEGKTCSVYRYKYRPADKKETQEGTVWLDTETGAIVQMQRSLDNDRMPLEIRKYATPELKATYQYDAELNRTYPVKQEINLEITQGMETHTVNQIIQNEDFWEYN